MYVLLFRWYNRWYFQWVHDINFDNTLVDKKSYKKILIYGISYKNFMSVKSLFIIFDDVYGVIKTYDGTRYFELFGSWFYHRFMIGLIIL